MQWVRMRPAGLDRLGCRSSMALEEKVQGKDQEGQIVGHLRSLLVQDREYRQSHMVRAQLLER